MKSCSDVLPSSLLGLLCLLRLVVDCDDDTVVYKVEQLGGAACHTGHRTCFFRRIDGDDLVTEGDIIFDPTVVYGKK